MSAALERAIPRRPAAWGAWAAVAALGATGMAVLARATAPPALGACWWRESLHLSCPTCGLTRSLWLLAHGDPAGSLAMHPLGAVLLLELVMGWVWWGAWLGGRASSRPDRLLPRAIAVNAVALLALWGLRLLTGTLPAA